LPAPAESKSPDVLSVRIATGLLREQEIAGKNRTARIVNAHQFSLTVQSIIPCTEFAGMATGIAAPAQCGIRPMGKTNLHSAFSVTANRIVAGKHVKVSAITGDVPDALWGKSEKEGVVPLPNQPERKTIAAALGLRIVSIPRDPANSLPAIALKEFQYENISKSVDWSIVDSPSYVRPEERWSNHRAIWSDDEVRRRRSQVFQCLREQMPPGLLLDEPQLEQLSVSEDYFQQQPEMNAVGY
jgi:hypothetical protein